MNTSRKCTCRHKDSPAFLSCICTSGQWERGGIRAVTGSGCFLVGTADNTRKAVASLMWNCHDLPSGRGCPKFLPAPSKSPSDVQIALFGESPSPEVLYPLLRPRLYRRLRG